MVLETNSVTYTGRRRYDDTTLLFGGKRYNTAPPSLGPVLDACIVDVHVTTSVSVGVLMSRFGTKSMRRADRYLRSVRRELRMGNVTCGVSKRLAYEVSLSSSIKRSGRELSFPAGYRVDGDYLTRALAGKLFVCTQSGAMHKVPLMYDGCEIGSGGMHDSVIMVLSGNASDMLDGGEWPIKYLPSKLQLSTMYGDFVRLRESLAVNWTQSQYIRATKGKFAPMSLFGEVMLLMIRVLMMDGVVLMHMCDTPRLFVESYCGLPDGQTRLAKNLRKTSFELQERPSPQSWMLGTLLQFSGLCDVRVSLLDVNGLFNQYTRNTVPVFVKRYLTFVRNGAILCRAGYDADVLDMLFRESFDEYLRRCRVVFTRCTQFVESGQEESNVTSCLDVIAFGMFVSKFTVERFNKCWYLSGWQLGRVESSFEGVTNELTAAGLSYNTWCNEQQDLSYWNCDKINA